MKIHRRGMLGGMLGALVGKPKIDQASLSGISVSGLGQEIPISHDGALIGSLSDDGSWIKNSLLRQELLNRIMPDWYKQKIADDHRSVSALDYDIAGYVSVSMGAKLNMQRQRLIDAAPRESYKWAKLRVEEAAWEKLMGIR